MSLQIILRGACPNLSLIALPGGKDGIHRLQNQVKPPNPAFCIREARDAYAVTLLLNLESEAPM